MAASCVQRRAVGIWKPRRKINEKWHQKVVLINMKMLACTSFCRASSADNKIVSDKVGAELCSKTGGGNLETATKNERKMAPESGVSQREKGWRAPAFAERNRQIIK